MGGRRGVGWCRRMDKKDSSEKTAVAVRQRGSQKANSQSQASTGCALPRGLALAAKGAGRQWGKRGAVGEGSIGLAVSVIGSVGCVTLRAAKRSERNQEKND